MIKLTIHCMLLSLLCTAQLTPASNHDDECWDEYIGHRLGEDLKNPLLAEARTAGNVQVLAQALKLTQRNKERRASVGFTWPKDFGNAPLSIDSGLVIQALHEAELRDFATSTNFLRRVTSPSTLITTKDLDAIIAQELSGYACIAFPKEIHALAQKIMFQRREHIMEIFFLSRKK